MTLQEYLIQLGWRVDEPSFKKFLNAVSQTGALTAQVGSVALETATAIELMVSRVARQYEALYYVSRRTGQSVQYIQSTQFAFRQIGLSADDATASIESMAATLRTQPWLRALFGGASTPQQVASRLGQSGLPYFLQARFAEMIGMDEKTLFHLQQFAAVEADAQEDFARRQREAGIDPGKFALQAKDFGRALNTVESDLEIFGDRMAIDFFKPVMEGIDAVSKIVQWLNRADVATKGWLGTIETLIGTTGGLWIVEKILSRLLGFGGATITGAVASGVARAVGGGAILRGAGAAGGAVFGGAAGYVTGPLGWLLASTTAANQDEANRPWNQPLGPPGAGGGGSTTAANQDEANRPWNQPLGPPGAGGGGSPTDRLNQGIKFFMEQGYSREAATGIMAGLFYESDKTLSPTAKNMAGGGQGAHGIGQWRAERLAAFKRIFDKDVWDATYEEQLQFQAMELAGKTGDFGATRAGQLLRSGKLTAGQAAGTFINLSERPGDQGVEAGRAASFADRLSALATQQNDTGTTNNVTVNTNTNINLTGNGAGDAANRVAAAQDKVAQNTTRAVVGALR